MCSEIYLAEKDEPKEIGIEPSISEGVLMQTEASLRQEVLRTCRILYKQGFVAGFTGSISVHLSDGEILCTRLNSHKGLITDEDVLVVDLQGNLLRGDGKPPIEISAHLAAYQSRTTLRAIVHAHPPICMAFTLAGLSLEPPILPNVVKRVGAMVTLPYRRLGTDELAQLVGEAFIHRDAVLLERQGALCGGSNLLEALALVEEMEQLAQVVLQARNLGVVQPMTPAEAIELRKLSLDQNAESHEHSGVEYTGLPPVATSDLAQPTVNLDPFDNRRRLIDPNGLYGI